MQSGYSELLGLYPPGEAQAPEMTTGEQQAVDSTTGRGMPGIAVTDSATINTELGV